VFDFALHFRCLQKATEALFEMGQASLAAGIAWQNRLQEELTQNIHMATNHENLMPMDPMDPFAAWQQWMGQWAAAGSPPRSNAIEDAWQAWTSPATNAFVAGASGLPSLMSWQASPWSIYQAPLMAMLLNYGVPYSVAAPTARASTCALDAADAICAQWRSLLSNANGRDAIEYPVRRSAYLH
jgi:hypothetical protein